MRHTLGRRFIVTLPKQTSFHIRSSSLQFRDAALVVYFKNLSNNWFKRHIRQSLLSYPAELPCKWCILELFWVEHALWNNNSAWEPDFSKYLLWIVYSKNHFDFQLLSARKKTLRIKCVLFVTLRERWTYKIVYFILNILHY